MAVEVTPLNILATGGGGGSVNTFADSFNRVGPDLGSNWLSFSGPFTPIGSPPNYFQGVIPGTNDRVAFQPGGGVNNATWAPPIFLIPRAVINSLNGVTQFSQMTWRTLVNTSKAGPAVLCNDKGDTVFQLYALSIEAVGTQRLALRRFTGATTVVTLNGDCLGGSCNAGDVIRLSADLSVGGQCTLRVSRNGVLASTNVDNAGFLNTGCPGMQCQTATTNPSGVCEWDDFSCGPGL